MSSLLDVQNWIYDASKEILNDKVWFNEHVPQRRQSVWAVNLKAKVECKSISYYEALTKQPHVHYTSISLMAMEFQGFLLIFFYCRAV